MKYCFVERILDDHAVSLAPIAQDVLGFQEGSTAFYFLIKSEYAKEKRHLLTEYRVFVSPIDPEIWSKLYDLNFVLGDEPGSFARLSKFLAERGVSIQMGESRTRLWNVRAGMSVLAYFKDYEGSVSDLNRELSQMVAEDSVLRRYIKPIIVEGDTEVWVTGNPSQLSRVTFRRQYAPGKVSGVAGTDTPIPIPASERFGVVEDSSIRLPSFVVTCLDRHYGLPSRRWQSIAGDGYAIVIADSETRLLSITFPDPGARIIEAEFHLGDGIGNLAKTASVLSEEYNFNLLEARQFTLEFAVRAKWQIIADIRKSSLAEMSINEMEEQLTNRLEDESGLDIQRDPVTNRSVKVVKALGRTPDKIEHYAYDVLRELESELRGFLVGRLQVSAGDDWWKERIPPDVRERAEDRFASDSLTAQEASPNRLIEYVDFSDYVRIILRKNNWSDTFEGTFPNREWIATRLQELEPIRNRLSHARSLTRTDLVRLELFSEDILRNVRTTIIG